MIRRSRSSAAEGTAPAAPAVRLGVRANLGQFLLLVGVNLLVGAMVGQERTVLPLLARREFGLTGFTAAMTFLVAFGAVKALTNLVAGTLSDRVGRRPLLVAGWLIGLPVPFLLAYGPGWGWVILANVLLGLNQGLCWSAALIMKIDLVGPRRRGVATGLNEAAGYGGVAVTALVTGYVAGRAGLRPEPFFLGMAVAGLGLGLSALLVRETRGHARHESRSRRADGDDGAPGPRTREVFATVTFRDRSLLACSQAGLVNNLEDAMAWGLLPLFFAGQGLSVGSVGVLSALYPAVWAASQLVTGPLSDRIGRKWLIVGGMWTQAAAVALIAATRSFGPWAAGAVLKGVGTAMVYPTLLAAVGDVAHPGWRASALGVYRFWRDAGFVVGGLLVGLLADAFTPVTPIWVVAGLGVASGAVVLRLMREARPG